MAYFVIYENDVQNKAFITGKSFLYYDIFINSNKKNWKNSDQSQNRRQWESEIFSFNLVFNFLFILFKDSKLMPRTLSLIIRIHDENLIFFSGEGKIMSLTAKIKGTLSAIQNVFFDLNWILVFSKILK